MPSRNENVENVCNITLEIKDFEKNLLFPCSVSPNAVHI